MVKQQIRKEREEEEAEDEDEVEELPEINKQGNETERTWHTVTCGDWDWSVSGLVQPS